MCHGLTKYPNPTPNPSNGKKICLPMETLFILFVRPSIRKNPFAVPYFAYRRTMSLYYFTKLSPWQHARGRKYLNYRKS